MNKTIAITAIALVSIALGMSAIAPAMGVGNPENTLKAPLYKGDCNEFDLCEVIVDANRNGCDEGDRRITIAKSVFDKMGLSDCPFDRTTPPEI